MLDTEINPATIRFYAIKLLSMREHSVGELYEKLSKKYPECEHVQTVIQQLIADDYQSNERFTRAFVAMRKRQGKGALLVNMELKARGISTELIQEFLQPDAEEWNYLAAVVRQKKFGNTSPKDSKIRAKQMRFLAARGFNGSCIQFAFKCDAYNSEFATE